MAMTQHVGKRYRAMVRLADPMPPLDIGEEFTVTPEMVAVIITSMGPMNLVDFDSLLATGAIEPVTAPAPMPAPTKARPADTAGG